MTSRPSISFQAATSPEIFDQIVELGDRNSRTLGFLPFAGFRAAAAEHRIGVALTDHGAVMGYCLFDLPRDVVRIVHVCVSDAARGSSLARTLVDSVSERHSDRLGLVLKCRADWPADRMWPKLGFTAQTQVPGRSRQQHPLTVWWRSHGHADLFTLLDERRLGRAAAIDSNIYCDLHSSRLRHGAQDTAVLASLIADDQLNLVLLPSLEAEIYATRDAVERKRFLNAKLNYARAMTPFSRDVVEHLASNIPEDVLKKDASLLRDAELVAEAHANNVDLFVTRDRNAIRFLTAAAADFGVEVLHPTEVPTYLDVEQAHHTYQPAQLQQTTFTVQRLDRALSAHEVAVLLDQPGGERLGDLRRLLADLASRATKDIERSVIFDRDSHLQAVWASHNSEVLEVPLFRVAKGRLQTTIATQLSGALRAHATTHGQSVIHVTDGHVPAPVRKVLEADGFYSDEDGLVALALPRIGSWPTISSAAQQATGKHRSGGLLRLLELPDDPSTTQSVEFERLWAPVKILGQGIPNYLIPIKRPFASQLLGYPASLMSRPDALGLSREHVYYSSKRGPVRPPARILWYVSGKVDPAVIGSSSVVEVRIDTPERLHRLYARLGVWSQSDVQRAASSTGRAAALRFTDTELFPNPVGLDRIRAMAPDGRKLLLRSAYQLDDEWYERIYRTGVQR